MLSEKSSEKSPWSLNVAVFLFFLSVYTIVLPKYMATSDCLWMLRVCQSLVEDGDVNILNQCRQDGREHIAIYSGYPIAPSLVGIPFYALAKLGLRLWGRPQDVETLFAAATLSSAVVSALTCLLLFHFVLSLGYSRRTGLLLASFYGLGTTAVWQARFLATEPVNALSILGAAYMAYLYKTTGRSGWLYLSGGFSGLAVASRDFSVIIVPFVLVYLLMEEWAKTKNAALGVKIIAILAHGLIFWAGLIPFLALTVWYNFERFGVVTNTNYLGFGGSLSDIFGTSIFVGLFGFLLSPGRSIFLYWPVVVLIPFSLKPFYREHKAESLLIFSIFLSHLLIYAKCNYWEGGGSFGPRYLFPTLPLLVLPATSFLEALPTKSYLTKAAVLFIFCAGVIIQGAAFYLSPPPEYGKISEMSANLIAGGTYIGGYLPEFAPYAHPILWVPSGGVLASFYFFPEDVRSLRLPALAFLLVVTMSTGTYLLKKMSVAPNGQELRSLFAKVIDRIRYGAQLVLHYRNKIAVGVGASVLVLISYALFNYVWAPIRHFNSKPFGALESPPSYPFTFGEPVVTGILEIRGWLLDSSGIQAIEVYLDDVKVAKAEYGNDSPDVHDMYPYIPNSHRARYSTPGVDTSAFSNGIHNIVVKALNGRGRWSAVSSSVVLFVNERPYDFFAHVSESTTSPEDAVEDSQLSINQEARRVLLQRPDSKITFAQVPVNGGAVLTLGIGLLQENAVGNDKGLVLEVLANADTPLLAMTLNPQAFIKNPKWVDERVDLSPFAGQVISLTFIVKTQAGHNITDHRIGWSNLNIVYPEQAASLLGVRSPGEGERAALK